MSILQSDVRVATLSANSDCDNIFAIWILVLCKSRHGALLRVMVRMYRLVRAERVTTLSLRLNWVLLQGDLVALQYICILLVMELQVELQVILIVFAKSTKIIIIVVICT